MVFGFPGVELWSFHLLGKQGEELRLHLSQPFLLYSFCVEFYSSDINSAVPTICISLNWPTGPFLFLICNVSESCVYLSECAIAEILLPGGLETSSQRTY